MQIASYFKKKFQFFKKHAVNKTIFSIYFIDIILYLYNSGSMRLIVPRGLKKYISLTKG